MYESDISSERRVSDSSSRKNSSAKIREESFSKKTAILLGDDDIAEEQPQQHFLKLNTDGSNTEKRNSPSNRTLPPLSQGGARIVVVEEENGEHVPAMILTTQMIKEWNIILRSKRRASEYSSKILRLRRKVDELESQKIEILDRRAQLREEREDLTNEEFAALPNVLELRAEFQELAGPAKESLQELNMYKEKLEQVEEAAEPVRAWLERYWGFVMDENNLTEPDYNSDEEMEEKPEDYDPFQFETHEPTPSDIAREEFYVQMQKTRDKLEDLEVTVNNWQQHYDEELTAYLAACEDGTCHNSRTIFDLCLLEESQDKIGQLIAAEKEYDEAMIVARKLGMDFGEESEASFTPSAPDDGYTLSFEDEMSSSVDKRWILAWAETIEDEDPEEEPECDDWNEWEVKSLAQNERDSVVYEMMARGKMRKKIDKWKSMCEAVRHPEITIPLRSSQKSVQSSDYDADYPSAESSPFTTSPLSPGFTRHSLPSQLQSPVSPDFSSTQSSPFITTPITPSSFRTFEIGVRRGLPVLSPDLPISPFSRPVQRETQQNYGPFSPVDIQDDLYREWRRNT